METFINVVFWIIGSVLFLLTLGTIFISIIEENQRKEKKKPLEYQVAKDPINKPKVKVTCELVKEVGIVRWNLFRAGKRSSVRRQLKGRNLNLLG